MKKITLTFAILLITGVATYVSAQHNRADIFKVSEITWFGLDFSNIRLIGPEGFTDPKAIKEVYFLEINNLVRLEPDKYDLKKIFSKQSVNINLDVARERIKLADENTMVLETGAKYQLDETAVKSIVAEYDITGNEGIGCVFIMETFEKASETGSMWVTFFDSSSKEVLLTERMSAKAGGFGWRNYWAKTFYNVLVQIQKTQYKAWAKG